MTISSRANHSLERLYGYQDAVVEQAAKYGVVLDPVDHLTYIVKRVPAGRLGHMIVSSHDGSQWQVSFDGEWTVRKHLGDALKFAATRKPTRAMIAKGYVAR